MGLFPPQDTCHWDEDSVRYGCSDPRDPLSRQFQWVPSILNDWPVHVDQE